MQGKTELEFNINGANNVVQPAQQMVDAAAEMSYQRGHLDHHISQVRGHYEDVHLVKDVNYRSEDGFMPPYDMNEFGQDPFAPQAMCRQETDEDWPTWSPARCISGGDVPGENVAQVQGEGREWQEMPAHGFDGEIPRAGSIPAAQHNREIQEPFEHAPRPQAEKNPLVVAEAKPKETHKYRRKGNSLVSKAHEQNLRQRHLVEIAQTNPAALNVMLNIASRNSPQVHQAQQIKQRMPATSVNGPSPLGTATSGRVESSMVQAARRVIQTRSQHVPQPMYEEEPEGEEHDDIFSASGLCRQGTDDDGLRWQPQRQAEFAERQEANQGAAGGARGKTANNAGANGAEKKPQAAPQGVRLSDSSPYTQPPTAPKKRGRYRRKGNSLISQAHEAHIRERKLAQHQQKIAGVREAALQMVEEQTSFMLKFCPECGGPVPPSSSARFCQYCGTGLSHLLNAQARARQGQSMPTY